MSDFSRESMLDMFIYEMNQLLEQLEQLIIQCEQGYSMNDINEIFRIMHTIKGSSAMMLYENVSKTAHSIEDLFFYIREENPEGLDYSKLTDVVLEGFDFIKVELLKIENGESSDADPTDVISVIKKYLDIVRGGEGLITENTINESSNTFNESNRKKVDKLTLESSQTSSNFLIKVIFDDDCEMRNIRAFNLITNLKEIMLDCKTIPEDLIDESSDEFIKNNGASIILSTENSIDELEQFLDGYPYIKSINISEFLPKYFSAFVKFEDGCEMENIRSLTLVNKLLAASIIVKSFPEDLLKEENSQFINENGLELQIVTLEEYDTISSLIYDTLYLKDFSLNELDFTLIDEKVEEDIEKIEEIIEDIVEIPNDKVISEKENSVQKKQNATPQQMISVNISKLDQLVNLMGELVISEAMTTQNPDLNGLDLENFNKSARQLRKIIKDVQDTVMSMRMVSLSTTFFKMHRIVRDMCKGLGKNIELVIQGEETEVDKNIIEHISDPIMHIIRNSADHGVETPDVREENGKDPKGTIWLEAKNFGGEVLISIKDDGAGINREKVFQKAKNAGLLKKPDNEYTDREIYQFIFHPGLSTKEAVTSFSGRGVGMDVVISNIEEVGGNIIVESDFGKGTTTILKIPLTLAIIEGMLISLGGAKYTIPISSIKETFKCKTQSIFTDPDGNEMITVRGEVFNVVRLYEFFNAKTDITELEEGVFIMLENEGNTVCLFVDELIGEQQVVVKTMPRFINRVKGISGCTLLGNGDIALIIDIVAFFDK